MESSYDYILFQKITDNIFFLVLNDKCNLRCAALNFTNQVIIITEGCAFNRYIQEGNVFSDWVDDVMIKEALMSTKL